MLIDIEAPILEAFITQKAGLLPVTGGCRCFPPLAGQPCFLGEASFPSTSSQALCRLYFPCCLQGQPLGKVLLHGARCMRCSRGWGQEGQKLVGPENSTGGFTHSLLLQTRGNHGCCYYLSGFPAAPSRPVISLPIFD